MTPQQILGMFLFQLLITSAAVIVAQDGDITQVPPSDSAVTWYVSQDICTTSPCSCHHFNSSYTLVNCSCHDKNQVVNLESGSDPGRHFTSSRSLSFRIENCFQLKIHPQAFALVTGPYFYLNLSNIGQLQVMESAFELNSQILSRNLFFNNVSIESLPPKSFPSSLNRLTFLNSEVTVISSLAFKGKTLQQLLFQNSRITSIQSKAFDEEILINNSWIVDNCDIGTIQSQGIASSITNMTWTSSRIGTLYPYSFSGIIPLATFRRNIFQDVHTNGLTLKDWTEVTFLNNSFGVVESSGIDLTQHSSQVNVTLFQDNQWGIIAKDFIKVGHSSPDVPFTLILNNTILQPCNCTPLLFIPQVTLEGSTDWFQQQMWNNSQCLTTPKGSLCLGRSDPSEIFVSYSEWPELCSESTFLCMNELVEVHDPDDEVITAPPLTGKLRILAIFVGTVALAIILALVTVICVYVCRRDKGRPEKPELGQSIRGGHSLSNGTHSTPQHPYGSVFPSTKIRVSPNSNAPLPRPRSGLFDDVEMEDKSVQTLPSDLSSEVFEGLREKLTDPESFWDAKETIDHLYDLIHVSEDSKGSTSPPDVTVMPKVNGVSKPSQRSTSTTTHFPPIRSSSLVPPQSQNQGGPVPRYAQIRSKPTRTHINCQDYSSPPVTTNNLYAEVRKGLEVKDHRPQMCDYTEPQDVQAHVYAELSSFPTVSTGMAFNPNHLNKTLFSQRHRPIGRLTTPPTVPLFPPPPNLDNDPGTSLAPCQQRPLPSIPPPFSTCTLK